MKQLRFRIWDAANNKLLYSNECGEFYEFFESGKASCGNEDDAEQFTNLLDSDGKEIYAGDICSVSSPQSRERLIGVVSLGEYSDNEYVSRLETWMFSCSFVNWCDELEESSSPLSCAVYGKGVAHGRGLSVDENSIKVIGNIHQHSHFLMKQPAALTR